MPTTNERHLRVGRWTRRIEGNIGGGVSDGHVGKTSGAADRPIPLSAQPLSHGESGRSNSFATLAYVKPGAKLPRSDRPMRHYASWFTAPVTSPGTVKHVSPARVGRPDRRSSAESAVPLRSDVPHRLSGQQLNASTTLDVRDSSHTA